MKARIIRIGNSRGVRIPKALLAQSGIEGEVEIEAMRGRLVVRPARRPREGWEDDFRRLAAAGEDALLDRDSLPPTRWEKSEWEW